MEKKKYDKRSATENLVDLILEKKRIKTNIAASSSSSSVIDFIPEAFIKRPAVKQDIIFVGTNEFIITKNISESMKLSNYIESILNSAYYFIKINHYSILQNAAPIILQMMYKISKLNGIILPNELQYKCVDLNLELAECVFFIDDVIYLNYQMIRRILTHPLPYVSIDFGDELRASDENADTVMLNLKTNSLKSDVSQKLLILLVIADHACGHYFSTSKRDFVNHKVFAKNYYTLHSKLQIKPMSDSKNLLKFSSDFNICDF